MFIPDGEHPPLKSHNIIEIWTLTCRFQNHSLPAECVEFLFPQRKPSLDIWIAYSVFSFLGQSSHTTFCLPQKHNFSLLWDGVQLDVPSRAPSRCHRAWWLWWRVPDYWRLSCGSATYTLCYFGKFLCAFICSSFKWEERYPHHRVAVKINRVNLRKD